MKPPPSVVPQDTGTPRRGCLTQRPRAGLTSLHTEVGAEPLLCLLDSANPPIRRPETFLRPGSLESSNKRRLIDKVPEPLFSFH